MGFHVDDLMAVPHKPGVYFFYDKKGTILYIGKAKDLKNRIKQYFATGSVWKQDMLEKATKVDFVVVTTESEALYLENNLIKKHQPIYNSLLKADNSYVYIKITKDPFPLVLTTRMRTQDGGMYIGPKHFTRELYKLLQYIRQLLRYRGCGISIFRKGEICSDYHFGLCAGRCVYEKWVKKAEQNLRDQATSHMGDTHEVGVSLGINSAEPSAELAQHLREIMPITNTSFVPEYTYEQALAQQKKIKKTLVDFFAGKTKPIQDHLLAEMKKAVEGQRFEYAARLRDILGGITLFTEKQYVVIPANITGKIMKIREMEGRYVLAVVNLYEGKMIDIIRLKYRKSDTEKDDIVSDFHSEYGEYIVTMKGNETRVQTKDMKRIKQEYHNEISALLDRFIDAYVASSTFEKENVMNDLLKGLKNRYEFPRFPYMIECTDISHLSGSWTSGSVVNMKEGLLNKKGYRKYKINKKDIKKCIEGQSDDYASLREVLLRKFHGVDIEKDFIPDVFILDGGKGQLGIIRELYEEKERFRKLLDRIHFCALGKGDARKRAGKIAGEKEAVYRFEPDSIGGTWKIKEKELIYDDVDRLITSLRDEAHRFANAYRKKQMSMEWKNPTDFSGKSKVKNGK